jgi:2-keto-3-deoxy-L-rhamnonate aldolase RhmA
MRANALKTWESNLTDARFKERLKQRQPLVGTFVKTASHQTIEVLANTGLDFVVIDAEHAPFGPNMLDVCLLAASKHHLNALVRLSQASASHVLQSLDMGAVGVLVPHASDPQEVEQLSLSSQYQAGTRGFSNSPRAGEYGQLNMKQLIEKADQDCCVIFQIEDAQALDMLDALASIESVDGYLIGRADLAVSMRVFDVNSPEIDAAILKIAQACERHQKALGIFVSSAAEVKKWLALGLSFFIVGSDQSMLAQQAKQVSQLFHTTTQGSLI